MSTKNQKNVNQVEKRVVNQVKQKIKLVDSLVDIKKYWY